jgi:phosphate uptake regulator
MLPEFEKKVFEIRKEIVSIAKILKKALEVARDSVKKQDKSKLKASINGDIKHLKYMAQSVDNSILMALVVYKVEAKESRELVVLLKITHELMGIFETLRKYVVAMKELLKHDGKSNSMGNAMLYISKLQSASIRSLSSVIDNIKTFNADDAMQLEAKEREEILFIIQKELLLERLLDHGASSNFFEIIKALKEYERILDHCENIVKLIDSKNESDNSNSPTQP